MRRTLQNSFCAGIKDMDVIIMAAGNGSRFGSNKLLKQVDGKPMYRHVVDLLRELWHEKRIDHVILVSQYEEILEETSDFLFMVKNEHPEKGISHTINLGLEKLLELSPGSEACLFTVADQPWMQKSTVERLMAAFMSGKIVVPRSGGLFGNPVIFDRCYYEELCAVTGDVGGRAVLKEHPTKLIFVNVDNAELKDLDYPEDLRKE